MIGRERFMARPEVEDPAEATLIATAASKRLAALEPTEEYQLVRVCVGLVVALVLSKMTSIRLSNAVIATLPTSPIEASVIAERMGFVLAPIILAQTIRVTAVVIVIPFALYYIDGVPAQRSIAFAGVSDPLQVTLLFALAIIGAMTFCKLGISNPSSLGPMRSVLADKWSNRCYAVRNPVVALPLCAQDGCIDQITADGSAQRPC
jgi:hypothetical protein